MDHSIIYRKRVRLDHCHRYKNRNQRQPENDQELIDPLSKYERGIRLMRKYAPHHLRANHLERLGLLDDVLVLCRYCDHPLEDCYCDEDYDDTTSDKYGEYQALKLNMPFNPRLRTFQEYLNSPYVRIEEDDFSCWDDTLDPFDDDRIDGDCYRPYDGVPEREASDFGREAHSRFADEY